MRRFQHSLVLLALAAGCLDTQLVPMDASVDATASDGATRDAASTCTECESDHCIDGACVECTPETAASDCREAAAPVCSATFECAAECVSDEACTRYSGLPECASEGPLVGQCVECDVTADCASPAAARCDANACTTCTSDDDCTRFADTPSCATEGALAGQCVACVEDADCTDPGAARCDAETHTCAPCTDRAQCAGTGANECAEGTCVACTEDTAATHCGANSCDPVAMECTSTPRNSLGSCQPCLSDTECFGDAACVPMLFEGATRGHYCLDRPPVGGCAANEAPYRVAIADRASRSGAGAAAYCGINEDLTTCEAVRGAGEPCVEGSDTCGPGGLCAFVGPAGAGSFTCTYACSLSAECRVTGALSLCTDLPGDDYCGRR